MSGIGKAARWGLAISGTALTAKALWPWLFRFSGTPVSARRFVYVTVAASGVETLWLAELNAAAPGVKRTARTVKKLGTLPGHLGVDGVPETYAALAPSPPNRHMAVMSTQMGLDFTDHNIRFFDLHDGSGDVPFNEHRFSGINRSTCASAVFDAFRAAEAANGVPPDVLAAYDWAPLLEGSEGANIPPPSLGWRSDDTLVVTFRFEMGVTAGFTLGPDSFRFRAKPGQSPVPACDPGPPPAAPLAGPLTIAPAGGSHAGVITFHGAPLPFVDRKGPFPSPFTFLWGRPRFKRARGVAGYAA